ncbi:c2 domain-containing protein [Anaeramoeba flamelloides]|uniref:C2 domain-containing protein n=1 Tax=Anaeramoeba flamelloides TaxID=1746091 RepID=A0AAV8AD18_9EUKA|nr:c2 domain-containing protein [Anaeramoeba flamelloides]
MSSKKKKTTKKEEKKKTKNKKEEKEKKEKKEKKEEKEEKEEKEIKDKNKKQKNKKEKKTKKKKKSIKVKESESEKTEEVINSSDEEPILSTLTSGQLRVCILNANNLTPVDKSGYSDPYVVIQLTKQCKSQFESVNIYTKQTPTKKKNLNPEWKKTYYDFNLKRPMGEIILTIYDYNRVSKPIKLGETRIPLEEYPELFENHQIGLTKELVDLPPPHSSLKKKLQKKNQNQKKTGKPTITFQIKFVPRSEKFSKISKGIEILETDKLHYKIFKGETLESIYESVQNWLHQASEYGVRSVQMMDGKNPEEELFVALWFTKVSEKNKNTKHVFCKDFI